MAFPLVPHLSNHPSDPACQRYSNFVALFINLGRGVLFHDIEFNNEQDNFVYYASSSRAIGVLPKKHVSRSNTIARNRRLYPRYPVDSRISTRDINFVGGLPDRVGKNPSFKTVGKYDSP